MKRSFSSTLAILSLSIAMQPIAAFAQVSQSYSGTEVITGQFVGYNNNMLTLGIGNGTRLIYVPSTLTVGQTYGSPLALSALTVGMPLSINCVWDAGHNYYVASSIALADTTLDSGYGSGLGTVGIGGTLIGDTGYGLGSDWGTPCCTKPAYPYSNLYFAANSLNAFNSLFDFDKLFAASASISERDALNAYNANAKRFASAESLRESDSAVKANRQTANRYDQWDKQVIIKIDKGVSTANATNDSFQSVNHNRSADKAVKADTNNVSSFNTAHALDKANAVKSAESLNKALNSLNTNSVKKNLMTGYTYTKPRQYSNTRTKRLSLLAGVWCWRAVFGGLPF